MSSTEPNIFNTKYDYVWWQIPKQKKKWKYIILSIA